MANYDLSQYDTVDSRLTKFWSEHPEGAVHTLLLTDPGDTSSVVFRSEVYFDREDKIPAGVGHAYGSPSLGGMVDKKASLENGETSAIGRALASAGFKAKIDSPRPSREEMEKSESFERPVQAQGYSRTAPRAGDGETFPDHFARNMKTVELVEFAKKHDFRGTSVRQLKDEIEQTFKVKIGGSAPDGGCLPVDVGNALAYYVNELSSEQKEVIAAGMSDEGADGLF